MSVAMQPTEVGFFADLIVLDVCIDTAEGDGIKGRWRFGQRIIEEHGKGQLPHGELKRICESIGKGPREVQRRIQFATEVHSEEKLRHVVTHFSSWHDIVQRGLPSGFDVHTTSDTPEWATPQDLFDLLNDEFGFELDVCATVGNAKCASYFDEKDDGLAQDWLGTCWMNPPYGREIGRWMEKAHEAGDAGATVVCLVPARTDTDWWWDHARHGEVRFLHGRLRFGDAESGAPFPSAVVIFGCPASVKWWESWPK